MLKAVARSFARLIGAPLPEHSDGSLMPPEEYEEMMHDWNEQSRQLDEDHYWFWRQEEEDRDDDDW